MIKIHCFSPSLFYIYIPLKADFHKAVLTIFFVTSLLLSKAQPLHEYFFNNIFTATAGGPTLTQNLACSAAAGSFGTQTITTSAGSCSVANVFCWNAGGGLNYPNPSYITNQYTIHLFFQFNTLSGWTRIIDFSNSTADAGFYLLGNCLNFYPNGNVGTCPFFNPGTYYLYSFVRNGTTGVIDAYINGTLFGTYNDAGGTYRCATNTTPIIFFRDDNAVPCEVKSGCIKYASVTSATSTAAQINTVWTNICSIVLPIELGEFKAYPLTNSVDLNWTTLSEKNNKLFEVERSGDAMNFTKIGEVAGAGNSNSHKNYKFQDLSPKNGSNYYRLKQIDNDGAFKYSSVEVAEFNGKILPFHPSPSNGTIIFSEKHIRQPVTVRNTLGQEVFNLDAVPNNGEIDLNALPFGIYFVSVGTECHKLILTK